MKGEEAKNDQTAVAQTEKTFLLLKNSPTELFEKADIVAMPLSGYDSRAREIVLPFFCPENKLGQLKADLKKALSCGIRKFRVSSLFGLEMLKNYKDCAVAVSFPLPACNSLAVCEFRRLGVSKVQVWIELESTSIEKVIEKSPPPVEIYEFGRPHILVTRAEISTRKQICDYRNNTFTVEKGEDGITYLYPDKTMKIPNPKKLPSFHDFTHSSTEETDSSRFNYDRILE